MGRKGLVKHGVVLLVGGVGVGVACRASVCRGQVSRVVGFGEQELKLLS